MTRKEKYLKEYGPVIGPVVLLSIAMVGVAGRWGDPIRIANEQGRHSRFMRSLPGRVNCFN